MFGLEFQSCADSVAIKKCLQSKFLAKEELQRVNLGLLYFGAKIPTESYIYCFESPH